MNLPLYDLEAWGYASYEPAVVLLKINNEQYTIRKTAVFQVAGDWPAVAE